MQGENGDDPYLSLLSYRTTPLTGSCKSPSEILMDRKLRNRLPDVESYVSGKALRKKDDKQKQYYDRGARVLKPLNLEDTVRVRRERAEKSSLWCERGQVLNQVAPNSYNVLLENGQVLRRNRRDLLKTGETFVPSAEDEVEPPETVTVSKPPETVTVRETQTSQLAQSSVPQTTRSGRPVKPPERLIEKM